MTTGRINQITTFASGLSLSNVLSLQQIANKAILIKISQPRKVKHDPNHIFYYLHQLSYILWKSYRYKVLTDLLRMFLFL